MNSNQVLEEARKINENIGMIDRVSRGMEQLYRRAASGVSSEEERRITAKMDEYIRDSNSMIASVHRQLKELERRNQSRPDPIAKTQITNLSQKFLSSLKQFQQVQVSYQKMQKSKMERQYRIVNPNATRDEIEEALSSDTSGPVFAQALQSARNSESRRVLQDVQNRHEAIVQLARSIEQLQNLFNEMQIMIETQDKQIDQVAVNFNEGRVNIESAANEMTLAVRNKRSATRRRCYLIIFCIVLIIVVFLIVFFVVVRPILQQRGLM